MKLIVLRNAEHPSRESVWKAHGPPMEPTLGGIEFGGLEQVVQTAVQAAKGQNAPPFLRRRDSPATSAKKESRCP